MPVPTAWSRILAVAIGAIPLIALIQQPGLNGGQRLLFSSLIVSFEIFLWAWWRCRGRIVHRSAPGAADCLTGFVVAIGDTLGIGSFAPTTAIMKLRGAVADDLIPGTLNVGLTPSAILEAFIFVTAVIVDPLLLVSVIGAAALGAWLGADIVGRLSKSTIQFVMGTALLIACTMFTLVNLKLLPGGGEAMALHGWRFVLAVSLNFLFGALMSAGIGLFAPCMILLALLGMHPLATFPIMMGACALLQPVASLRFFTNQRFAWGPSIGLALGSVPGALIGAYVIKSLDVTYLRWLVTGVVLYAAASMLRSAVTASRKYRLATAR